MSMIGRACGFMAGSVASDPHFSSVSLLLHGDGSNGGTTFTDHSPSPKTLTANGNVNTSTAEKKYGSASIAFDGTGDYLTCPSNADFGFGTGDFTVEAWVYRGATGAEHDLFGTTYTSGWLAKFLDSYGVVGIWINGVTYYSSNPAIPSANAWHHIAWMRSSGVLYYAVDGVVTTGEACTADIPTSGTFYVGTYSGLGEFHNGYLDEIRITKGVARYLSNFTPPTAAFPDA